MAGDFSEPVRFAGAIRGDVLKPYLPALFRLLLVAAEGLIAKHARHRARRKQAAGVKRVPRLKPFDPSFVKHLRGDGSNHHLARDAKRFLPASWSFPAGSALQEVSDAAPEGSILMRLLACSS